MRVQRKRGRLFVAFAPPERELLENLTTELVDLLRGRDLTGTGTRDPAVERLLPDAYRDDIEASREYRSLTESDLVDMKVENAMMLARAAGGERAVEVDDDEFVSWLRAITDLRLALATRLGIEKDDDEGDPRPEAAATRAAYWWLGALQERLIAA